MSAEVSGMFSNATGPVTVLFLLTEKEHTWHTRDEFTSDGRPLWQNRLLKFQQARPTSWRSSLIIKLQAHTSVMTYKRTYWSSIHWIMYLCVFVFILILRFTNILNNNNNNCTCHTVRVRPHATSDQCKHGTWPRGDFTLMLHHHHYHH